MMLAVGTYGVITVRRDGCIYWYVGAKYELIGKLRSIDLDKSINSSDHCTTVIT